MNTILVFAVALAVLGGQASSDECAPKQDSSKEAGAAGRKESPFACNRKAFTPEARKRHFDELGPMLRDKIQKVHELNHGYEFQFPADATTVQLVAEWAAGERLCCPFFNIEMRLPAEGGPLWLRLSGRKGTKQFIQADNAGWTTKK